MKTVQNESEKYYSYNEAVRAFYDDKIGTSEAIKRIFSLPELKELQGNSDIKLKQSFLINVLENSYRSTKNVKNQYEKNEVSFYK